jgi:hypothetical protein
VQQFLDFELTCETLEQALADKAYDSDKLNEQIVKERVEMSAPHRSNRELWNCIEDGRPMRRHKRCWAVERAVNWIHYFHCLCIHWEKSTTLVQGFLHLGCTVPLLKEVWG